MKHFLTCSIACILLFSACKKGEDDPAFSFKSRKTRLAGEWRMKSGRASYTYNKTYNETYAFDGTRFTHNKTSNGGPLVVYVGSYGLGLTIEKPGTFNMTERFISGVFNATGTWNFNAGVGKAKKKEEVEFSIQNVSSGSSLDEHMFNRSAINFVYHIRELKNKEIILFSSGRFYSSSKGDYIDFSTEFTLIQ